MLTWKMKDLEPLVIHAREAKEHRKTYVEQMDNIAPEPALHFVKDQGVYLMSNGTPGMPNPHGSGCHVVYAIGHDPERNENWYDHGRQECGGDDFVEKIPLVDGERGIKEGCTSLEIHLTPKHMEIRCTAK